MHRPQVARAVAAAVAVIAKLDLIDQIDQGVDKFGFSLQGWGWSVHACSTEQAKALFHARVAGADRLSDERCRTKARAHG